MELRDRCFLALLRDGLDGACSQESRELAANMDRVLQDQVLELARLHNLFPLLAQQMLLLNPPGLPREAVRSITIQALARQTVATQELLALTQALERAAVPALVVKGAVCRSLYPTPDLRPSSDEDILIRPEDLARAEEVFRQRGYSLQEEGALGEAVRTWCAPGLRVELHRSLCGDLTVAGHEAESWFAGCFNRSMIWNVGEGTVRTLGLQDHLLYLLLHFYKHFLAGGVGIRQLCDICLFVRQRSGELDWPALWGTLTAMHLERLVWNMMDLGVRYLGLAPHMVWGPPELPKADSEALLLDILDAGVFGSSTMERKHSSLITIRAASDGKCREGTLGSAIFPPAASLAGRYPYLRKWPCLLPVAWCARGLGYLKEGRNVGGRAAAAARFGRQRLELLAQYGLLGRKP